MDIQKINIGAFSFSQTFIGRKAEMIRILFSIAFILVTIDLPVYMTRTMGGNLYSQTKYPYEPYENRYEGILAKKLVAGERLVLLSAEIENIGSSGKTDSVFSLEFFSYDTLSVRIEVWEHDKLYKMQPFVQNCLPGIHGFSWPAKIPIHYDINLADLSPIAKTIGMSGPIFLPIRFVESVRDNENNQKYVFTFLATKSIDSLAYSIYDFKSKLLQSGNFYDMSKNQKIIVEWHGMTSDSTLAASGLYSIVVKAAYTPKPNILPKPPVTTRHDFFHRVEFFRAEITAK